MGDRVVSVGALTVVHDGIPGRKGKKEKKRSSPIVTPSVHPAETPTPSPFPQASRDR